MIWGRFSERNEKEAGVHESMLESLHKWSAEHAQLPCAFFPQLAKHCLPPGLLGQELNIVDVERHSVPAKDFCKRALGNAKHGQLQHLSDCCSRRHVPFRHAASPTLRRHPEHPPLAAQSLCMKAGICVCGRTLAGWRKFIKTLEQWLRGLLVKRKGAPNPGRAILKAGGAVLALQNAQQERYLWHVGYSNMKSLEVVLLRLEPASEEETLRRQPLAETDLFQR